MPPLRVAIAVMMAIGLLTGPAEAASLPKLSRGLLTTADLPNGYRAWLPEYQRYSSSSNPACSRTLDELEFSTPRFRDVEYARAGFTKGRFGPWILENLRRYPSKAVADRDLTRILGVLRGCASFSHAYTGEKATVVDLRLAPIRMDRVGSRSKALWITARANGSWAFGEILVLARTGRTLMILSQLSFKIPSAGAAQSLANRAAAKLREVAG